MFEQEKEIISIDIPDLTPEQFQRFASLIHDITGIYLKEHKITLLSNRLRKRLRELKLKDYDQYYDYLTKSDKSNTEMIHFLEVVTTNESFFLENASELRSIQKNYSTRVIKTI